MDNSILSNLLIVNENNGNYNYTSYTQQNLYNKTHNTNDTANALTKDLLSLYFAMENRAFGTDTFYHIPQNFYPNAYPLQQDATTKTIVVKNDTTNTQSLMLVVTFTQCTIVGYNDGCGHTWDGNPNIPHYAEWECNSHSFVTIIDDEETGGGGTSGGGDGGGTGNGGGGGNGDGSTPDPCQGRWYAKLPCSSSGGGGFEPDPFFDDECDPFVIALQYNNIFKQKIAELTDPDTTIQYEKAFIVNNLNNNQYTPKTGSIGVPAMEWSSAGGVSGFMHRHYAGLSPMFSAQDVIDFADVFIKENALDPQNLFYQVTTPPYTVQGIYIPATNYLIKVKDTAQFRIFAENVAGNLQKKSSFRDVWDEELSKIPNWEERMQYMMKKEKVNNAFEIYSGNSTGTEWKKLQLIWNGKDLTDPALSIYTEYKNCF
ncbi:hypothetical protein ACFOWM_09090 [Ferruginibacter yonginensis]|uniref:Uncharacterized protein n=1 Tax=Ferruginibacter yonginensis TaxID=1310416 RepID=A0ABV8QRU6_9BACT